MSHPNHSFSSSPRLPHFRFRRGFKQFFRCCPFVHVGPEVLTRREVVTSRYSCTGSPDHHRIVRNGKSTREKVSISLSETYIQSVANFLPFQQIRSGRFFTRVRGHQKAIVNHMVSIISTSVIQAYRNLVCGFHSGILNGFSFKSQFSPFSPVS